ncbi:MAG TPA: neutral/alkaline non-lysosomal ceramidase N-terminal domain-containing protein [Symbiobacteriaceae bacterium]|nr:neutral/alkaline non-lysosomal ceramidase N-terminal domain-containing protein [Symbiobacteriaceae bacterium]
MRLGKAVRTITPPPGLAMGGYAARQGAAEGAHDPLTVRALVLEEAGVKAALLVADLLMFPGKQALAIRRKAAKAAGLSPDDVIVAATHTHSGPVTFDLPELGGPADHAFVEAVHEAIAACAAEAAARLEPVRVGWGRAPVTGVGAVRRATGGRPAAVQDAGGVTVVAFSAPSGALAAVLMHYACHPTVLGADNRQYSADLLGAARAALEAELGGRVPVVAINGACGDVSTRFTRRSQTFDELDRLGKVVAAAAMRALSHIRRFEMPAGGLRMSSARVDLPVRSLPSPAEALAAVAAAEAELKRVAADPSADPAALRLARVALEGAQVQAQLAGTRPEGLKPEAVASLTALRFGDCGLVTVPGELFHALGEATQREAGLPCCIVVGYANGHVGYIPDDAAYDEGGYEVLSSHLERGAGRDLAYAAAALLWSLES